MIELDKLLGYVRKTNPAMTREKLIEELSKNRYSSIALIMIAETTGFQNNRKTFLYAPYLCKNKFPT